ncbi:Flp pilus assembly complex ATPase component TadA [Luteolibacter ambystomatis]|uniref:Flp pilus assembly complex ATPase component TadA n=1 Tax=Luteolibacter ambystomatis TaxID=2824561 RepID=A0A975G6S5_9BACT|nr:ATPase, T2SS/T4P/T4SS family [Luteolibacter ambystomatis]QUE49838.1 Flp pilus assembly complex ATPase component TadA [Luteolibacter ambystomatis]
MPAVFDFVHSAFSAGATDLLIAEDQSPRVRINGELLVFEHEPLNRKCLEDFWRDCNTDPASDYESDLSWIAPDGSRLRVNLYQSLGKLCAVLRPIKRYVGDFHELGLPQELLMNWLSHRSGLIVVSGPTGSGKSTTIASCLDWINHHYRRHIVTIEDPVEYIFENDLSHFSQRELGGDTKSFPHALRTALRQSPDIIFLGEIRDEDTAQVALRAAETGHLVLSTLHSPGATETLERLSNLYPDGQRESSLQLLSSHLVGVLCQRLLPSTSGTLHLVCESLQNEAAVREWVRNRQTAEIRDFLTRTETPGNVSMLRALTHAAIHGHISPATARAAAPNSQDLDRALRGYV